MTFLSAREAASLLGVTPATLYAYVSRGLLPVEKGGEGRNSRYPREAVLALKARRDQPRGADDAARASLDFGRPVAESGITLIENGRLYYRGRDVRTLAAAATMEEVATLIWGQRLTAPADAVPEVPAGLPFMERAHVLLGLAAAADRRSYDLSPAGVARTGSRILRLIASAAGAVRGSPLDPVHRRLAAGWGLDGAAADLVRAALVVCADHEFNPSTFATRIVASTGATPYAVVQAGIAALSGPKHGGITLRVEALVDEIGGRDPATALNARLRRGDDVPGFGHRLYPDNDPRAQILLSRLAADPRAAQTLAIAEAARALTGLPPTIDFALVALHRTLDLPEGAALALFTIGRVIGWIGHAIEQYASPSVFRPRASYTGPRPAADQSAL